MELLESQPPFSSRKQDDNVVNYGDFSRQREAQEAARYLAKLSHPAFIGKAMEYLIETGSPQPLLDGTSEELMSDPDPLDELFDEAYNNARTNEQIIALVVLQKFHLVARNRKSHHDEQLHVRNLIYTISNSQPPPNDPKSIA